MDDGDRQDGTLVEIAATIQSKEAKIEILEHYSSIEGSMLVGNQLARSIGMS